MHFCFWYEMVEYSNISCMKTDGFFFRISFIFLVVLCTRQSHTQDKQWHIDTVGYLPEPLTNTAVVSATVSDTPFVYAFGGLDKTKKYNGIHLRSYRYNTISRQVQRIEDIPDSRGKIAMAASRIGRIIYIIGGYHVYKNGAEKSSLRVHRFDTEANHFIPDAAPLPVPIDDHVQAVWRDSLIYVITGWSNRSNVSNVQVYNPVSNTWTAADPVPNNAQYKSFGASGCIVGDTIYYLGGASDGRNFPIQNVLRWGIIDSAHPTRIEWHSSRPSGFDGIYRSACAKLKEQPYWFGGSGETYNYDGKAYRTGKGVPPDERVFSLKRSQPLVLESGPLPGLPMDLRGAAATNDSTIYLMGGMRERQQVSDAILRVTGQRITKVVEGDNKSSGSIRICPNPANRVIYLCSLMGDRFPVPYSIVSAAGNRTLNGVLDAEATVDITGLPPGLYYFITSKAKLPLAVLPY